MVINWTDFARENVQDFVKISHATKYAKNLVNYVQILENSPKLGKPILRIKPNELRQLVYRKHRILYYVYDDAIFISAIVHASQDINLTVQYISRNFM